MHQPLVAHVGLRSLLDGLHAGQYIAMGQHHALGVAGGAGGEQDFERRLAREPFDRPSFISRQFAEPIFEGETGPLKGQLMQKQRIAHRQFGLHIGRHARGKLRAPIGVQRDCQHSAQKTAIEGRNPLRAVFPPQKNPVAGHNAPPDQQRGKAPRQPRNFSVAGSAPPDALMAHYRDLAVIAAKVVKQCSQMVAHESSGKFMVRHRPASGGRECRDLCE